MDETFQGEERSRVLIRLDTLIRLRWYAIAGQLTAVFIIAFVLGFPMPWQLCLLLIALSAALNLLLTKQYKSNDHISGNGVFILLAFDIWQLGTLIFLTGGLQNPFAILLMAPVVVSSTSLQLNHTLVLGTLAILVVTFLAFLHLPLPWYPDQPIHFPFILIAGNWAAIVSTLAFTAIYAFRVAQETRKLGDALSATELVLQREQHLSALDGLAAAAAHELGTPLATIALVSKEIANEVPKDSALFEDASLLRSQASRCREILQKLTSLSSDDAEIIQEQSLLTLVEEEAAPLREFDIEIDVKLSKNGTVTPKMKRNPGVQYGLGNLLDNATDFARKKIIVYIDWDEEHAWIEISDDGAGFPATILSQIGRPFISSHSSLRSSRGKGLGLGLFIAKTLLERSGAELTFSNTIIDPKHLSGAFVSVKWPRERLIKDSSES